MHSSYPSVKAEVHIADLTSNLHHIRSQISKDCFLCAVLKADAYGHGLEGMLKVLSERGLANMAAVAKLSELVQYRETIKDCGMDILLLGYSEVEEIRLLMENGLLNEERVIFSIYNLRQFHDLDKLGRALNKRFRVHIRLDDLNTGMGLGYEEFLNVR